MNDLTGQRFGHLTVIEKTKERKHGCIIWRCKCDCGNETKVTSHNLVSGDTKSCGCIKGKNKRKPKDLTGQRFGRLTAIEPAGYRKNNIPVWRCLCDCGNETEIRENALISGNTKSCGCLRKENLEKGLRLSHKSSKK